jgi:hypothetical protein
MRGGSVRSAVVLLAVVASCAASSPSADPGDAVPEDAGNDAAIVTPTPDAAPVADARADASRDASDAQTPPADSGPTCNDKGQRMCAGACVDTLTDPHDCGACGHDCGGLTCTNGSCDPIALSNAFVAWGGIAQDDSTIYFTGADGTLKSVPKSGGATRTIARMSP